MSGYRKFSDQWRQGAPDPTFATFATFAEGQAETSISEDFRGLVQQQQHNIDIISIFAPEAAEGKSEAAGVPAAKVAQSAKVLSPEWWRDEFEERAAIRQYDGGYSRAEAERLAWGELENRWHKEHGERVPPDLCASCRRPIGQAPFLDFTDGNRVHDSRGHECLVRHGMRWRGGATAPLIEMGLKPPADADRL